MRTVLRVRKPNYIYCNTRVYFYDFSCTTGQGQDRGHRFVWVESFQLKQKTPTCFKCFCQQMSTVGMSHIRLSAWPAYKFSHRASLLWTPSTPQQGHALLYKSTCLHTCLASKPSQAWCCTSSPQNGRMRAWRVRWEWRRQGLKGGIEKTQNMKRIRSFTSKQQFE